jgi:hypothetical protein
MPLGVCDFHENWYSESRILLNAVREIFYHPKSVHVRFVVEKVALGQVFFRVLQFSC